MEKLKATGGYDIFKKNRAADEKIRRDRIKNGLLSLPKAIREKSLRLKRAYSRRKMAEYRKRKNRKENTDPETEIQVSPSRLTTDSKDSYKTPSALSKAVAKVKRAMPSTSTKKKQVIAKILHSFDEQDQNAIISNDLTGEAKSTIQRKSTRASSITRVSSSDIELIKSFYQRDDISRMSSNMRDCKKFTDPIDGVEEIKQIRYLMYRLVDVYNMFVKFVQNGKSFK